MPFIHLIIAKAGQILPLQIQFTAIKQRIWKVAVYLDICLLIPPCVLFGLRRIVGKLHLVLFTNNISSWQNQHIVAVPAKGIWLFCNSTHTTLPYMQFLFTQQNIYRRLPSDPLHIIHPCNWRILLL